MILGIGNILLCDEGVGVRVVQAMREMALPPGVEVADGGTAGADLLDIISDRRKVIIIDAMDAGAEPGTIRHLRVEELAGGTGTRISLHEIGLMETLAMARHLNSAPIEVSILGVQPKEVRPGDKLTEELTAVVPRVVRMILDELGEQMP
ncbi:MAG: hydrogenase maturation protease [Sedimentisphaerales bacterium]|nr:hydrogenase maturation protease [Sedimentisphaerales bacterium]